MRLAGWHPPVADERDYGIRDGENITGTNPMYMLRQRLMSNLQKQATLPDYAIAAIMITAFNARKEGKMGAAGDYGLFLWRGARAYYVHDCLRWYSDREYAMRCAARMRRRTDGLCWYAVVSRYRVRVSDRGGVRE